MTTVDELTRAYGPQDEPPEPRRRMSRGKRLALFVAFLIGLPALALAATYLWGTFTGSAILNDSTASVVIEDVRGSGLTTINGYPAPGGVDCFNSTKGVAGPQGITSMDLVARAYRVTVNGSAPPAELPLGDCRIAVTVKNTGVAPGTVSAVLDAALPVGWSFSAEPPITIPGGQSKVLTITISATGAAQPVQGGTPFGGKLNIDIPPLGA